MPLRLVLDGPTTTLGIGTREGQILVAQIRADTGLLPSASHLAPGTSPSITPNAAATIASATCFEHTLSGLALAVSACSAGSKGCASARVARPSRPDHARVDGGDVTLYGNARTDQERQQAEAIAQGIPGVRSVENLRVEPGGGVEGSVPSEIRRVPGRTVSP